MLSPADAAVASRDPSLKGLATLLDPEALTHELANATGRVVDRVELHYLRYKPGTNCVAAYTARLDGESTSLYAKAYGPDSPVKLEKACSASERRALRTRLDRDAILVCAFPDDVKLPVLARLSKPDARTKLMGRIFDHRPGMDTGSLETLAYKPERRFVGHWVSEADSAVLKFYVGSARLVALAGSQAVASREILRVARRSGGSKRHGVLAFEWLPGRNLREILAGPEPLPALRLVGRAVAELHTQSVPGLPARRDEDRLRELRELAELLAVLCPNEAERADRLVADVGERLSGEAQATTCIHGDLYDKQILIDADRIGVIDLDRTTMGDPRIDLGLFLAHLERDVLLGRLPAHRVEAVEEELIDAYQDERGASLGPIAPYVAEALLHLAHHPFRTHHPDWPGLTASILDAAQRRLGAGT